MQDDKSAKSAVSADMVRQLAAASNLKLSSERMAQLTPDLQGLLDRVRPLHSLDVRGAQPSPPFKDEVWE
jgi:Asp-tRNA(Asn)/Glu-tRNA(Gln) amidotransferase C subunit